MSVLPPLNAATTFAPGTWFGAFGSLSKAVNAVTCEVSRPIKPIRKSSAAFAARVMTNTIEKRSCGRKFIDLLSECPSILVRRGVRSPIRRRRTGCCRRTHSQPTGWPARCRHEVMGVADDQRVTLPRSGEDVLLDDLKE